MVYFDGERTAEEIKHRWTKVVGPGFVKGPWTPEEDEQIIHCISLGMYKWYAACSISVSNTVLEFTLCLFFCRPDIAACVSGRTAKQCRERYKNQLNPLLRFGPWSASEDEVR